MEQSLPQECPNVGSGKCGRFCFLRRSWCLCQINNSIHKALLKSIQATNAKGRIGQVRIQSRREKCEEMAMEEQKQSVPWGTQKNKRVCSAHTQWAFSFAFVATIYRCHRWHTLSNSCPSTRPPSTQPTFWNACSMLQVLSSMTMLSKHSASSIAQPNHMYESNLQHEDLFVPRLFSCGLFHTFITEPWNVNGTSS